MRRLTNLLINGIGMEHHRQKLASNKVFLQRILRCILIAAVFLSLTISMGACAYHWMDHEPWVDAFLNAVMVMTGLGLVGNLTTIQIKIFTSFYALFSSVIFFMVLAILFAPLIHRFMHHFHLEIDKDK